VATTHLAFTERLVRRYLPARVATTNKAKQGHLVIVAGSDGMAGAASLCALAASRVGVGYTTVCSSNADTQSLLRSVLGAAPGVLFPKESALEVISSQRATAYAIGPGLPADPVTVGLLQELRSQSRPVVVDAGALTAIAQAPAQRWPESWVMTPHLGELARLLKRSVAELETDRFTAAQEASRQLGSHCLLKGFRSVLGCRQRALLIMSGNAALAKAGTGDVLTGMIGGLLAQGVPSLQAAASAAFIHGRLADDWVRSGRDKRSLLPHDLTDHLPAMLKRLSLPSFETF
jgi:NAD(P)H-hydrate epimerase